MEFCLATDLPLLNKFRKKKKHGLQRICRCKFNLQRKFRCNLKPFATDYPLQIKINLQRIFHCK